MSTSDTNNKHLLTVMVEDYFHVGAFGNLIQQRNWSNFVPRYAHNTQKALDLLDQYDTKATFFVLGWIAEQSPELVREIVNRGHEVASRGYYHRSLENLSIEEFREDLRRTNAAIETASGQKVSGYRAADKLPFQQHDWVLDVLAEEGFAYDSSFLPKRGDDPKKQVAHRYEHNDSAIWEFPYSTRDLGIGLLPISGGNYFRQIPYTLMRRAVSNWHKRSDAPFISYFHVWELDPEQPRISAASRYSRIRHYRNLDKMEWILHENLALYKCTGIADHLGIDRETHISVEPDMAAATEITVPANAPLDLTPVSIVIPCYNEQESLPYLAKTLASVEERLKKIGYTSQLIFVDDNSQDDTLAVIHSLFGDSKGLQVVKHDVNQGVAGGIVTGIRAARTEIVCSIDCDCTFDPHELENMIPMLGECVDLVQASPYHKDGGVQNVPGWRLLLSKGASVLFRRVLHTKIASYTACFRVMRRSSMIDIEPEELGFHGVPELLGLLDLKGGKIVEFPTVLAVRLFGASKMKTLKTIAGTVKLLSRLTLMRAFGKTNPIRPSTSSERLLPASKD
ncbi:MAG TPA: glycosyltransferase [Pyrinomonadaceae bacterium]|nr:glycosyltransferase [Chloracidobacterium sp.]MBP9935156.1 glycosyltransferase [Pyrinomonadaceae bacterium]MBK7803418.1 glycosyltransferase [Chloracidobacterium sp.]MBL0241193.1 glycosyltransferase [Chloracidobacterium sp.]HQY67814.1 glycosyltransferase [Pyrinomonadaceae bacterium]